MDKKIILMSLLFIAVLFNSQIKLEIKLIKNNGDKLTKQIEIKITNKTNDKYVIPIDTTDFKPFFEDGNCLKYDLFSFKETNDLLFALAFINPENNLFNNKIYNDPDPSLLLHSSMKVKTEFEKKKDSANKTYDRSINRWMKDFRLNPNRNWAEMNHKLFSSVLFLEPNQEIVFKKNIDPLKLSSSKMYETGNYFYSYHLEKNVKYNFQLFYCIDKKMYEYLAREQKDKLSGYQLFSGNLRSNVLRWD